jgi:YHS domain-containing protein
MDRPMLHPVRSRRRLVLRGFVALLAAAVGPLPAWAAVQWHADLATARAAARISQRPVLAVFTAQWSGATANLDATTFASDEAEALLAACFEPVRVDIDAHAALTHKLGITHVPTACILADDDTAVASFELTSSPTEFVAAAVRAAQQAAGDRPTAAAEEPVLAGLPQSAAPGLEAVTTQLSRDGFGIDHGSPVTEKVRRLADFATGATPTAPAAVDALAHRQAAAPAAPPQPMLPPTPPAWPPLAASAPPERMPAGPRPSIEPASRPATTVPAAPWLDAPLPAQPAPAPAVASQPSPGWFTAPPTAVPAQLPPTTSPAAAEAPKPNAFLAALQKPFTFRNPFAAAKPPADAPPPTMPPAPPQSSAALAAYPTGTAPPPAANADAFGSMPLGLEGYCPVTLVERGIWTEGRAQWGARHRGRTYLFAGERQQNAFLADPDRFAPALSGDDPVLALEGGRSTAGQRRYGVTYQSRTYLFASPETRAQFAADPGRYAPRVAVAEQPSQVVRR